MTPDEYVKAAVRTESAVMGLVVQGTEMRLLHASMGLCTEAGEFQDPIKKRLFYNKPLDLVNLEEELGDAMWYVALACDALGISLEGLMEKNLAKLRARYPKKFEDELANNRDLDKERQVLEGK